MPKTSPTASRSCWCKVNSSVWTSKERVSCGVQRGAKKQFKRNDKPYKRLAEHIGRFPAVMIAPDDAALIHDGSEIRRKWLDAVISQYDRAYLDALIDVNKALVQRNALLRYFAENRTFDATMLSPWNASIAPESRHDCQGAQGVHGRLFAGILVHLRRNFWRGGEGGAVPDDARLRRC